MCSRQEEISILNGNAGVAKAKFDKICCKCKERPAFTVIGTNIGYCQECFDASFVHKFRATIGKSALIRRGAKVALAYSGGACSSAALDILTKGISCEIKKRLRFEAGLLFVDESCLHTGITAEKVKEIQDIMEASPFDSHTVKLEKVLTMAYCAEKQENVENDDSTIRQNLQQVFASIKSSTAKEEILERLRNRLLSIEANRLGYDFVIVAESNSRLAVKTLCSVTMGRFGKSLQQDCAFSDGFRCKFSGGSHILRPMKDTAAKEIATYVNMHNLRTVFLPNYSTFQSKRDCIQSLTESFVVSLSVNFPATEMTIYKTSGKLKGEKKNDVAIETNICGLCHGDIDEDDAVCIDGCLDEVCKCFASFIYFVKTINQFAHVIPFTCKQLCFSCTNMLKESF